MMKKIVLLILLVFCVHIISAQIDPLYNQYLFNQQMINPAYVGIYNRFSAALITRAQWVGIDGAPITNTLTVQSALANGRIGIGTLLINDQLGVNNNTEFTLGGSYNIKIGTEGTLGMGLQAGLINNRYDESKLSVDFIDDPLINNGLNNSIAPNFGAGIMYMSPTVFIGASIPRILTVEAEDGINNSPRYLRNYYLSGGFIVETSGFMLYRVNGVLRYIENEGLSYELVVANYIDDIIWAGLSLRDLRDFGIFTSYEIGENIRIGYSLEFPINSLIQSNYGTHEISVAFDSSLIRGLRKRRF